MTPTGTVTFTIDGTAEAPVRSRSSAASMGRCSTRRRSPSRRSRRIAHDLARPTAATRTDAPSTAIAPPDPDRHRAGLAHNDHDAGFVARSIDGRPARDLHGGCHGAAYQGTPTGTVTFIIDGQAQTPVALALVGGSDEAQFTTSTLVGRNAHGHGVLQRR